MGSDGKDWVQTMSPFRFVLLNVRRQLLVQHHEHAPLLLDPLVEATPSQHSRKIATSMREHPPDYASLTLPGCPCSPLPCQR